MRVQPRSPHRAFRAKAIGPWPPWVSLSLRSSDAFGLSISCITGRRWPTLAGSSIWKVPWTLGLYAQLFLSSLLHRCSARASSTRPWNPNWYSGLLLNLRLLRRPAKQTSTAQLKTLCESRTTYRPVLSFAVVFFGFINITIVSFLPRTIWFSTAGDCRAQFLARFVLISAGNGFRWTLECGKTGADSCLPPQTQTQDTGKTGSKA